MENPSRDRKNRLPFCLLQNLYSGQEAPVRTEYGIIDWFQVGKGVRQCCTWSPCLFNFYAEYIMQSARLDDAQAGCTSTKLTRETSITSDMQMTPLLWQKEKRN